MNEPNVKHARPGEAREMLVRLLLTRSADCIIWPFGTNGRGYGVCHVDGRPTMTHVIACESSNGSRPPGMQCAHSCGTRRCMNRDHLRWATPAENQADRVVHGTTNRGERHGIHKLSSDQVLEIAARMGGEPNASLAAEFEVSPAAIHEIRTGRNWAWLTGVAA